MIEQKKEIQQLTMAVITGIILGVAIVMILATGCVSKHPKCAAYDKIETVK
jgi:hypothetical protein